MFDVTTLVNPAMSVRPQEMQALPAQPMQDVLRLDNVVDQKIMVGTGSETRLDAAGASMRDAPVLQIKEPVTSETPDFKHLMLNKASEMDKSYHNMMTQFSNVPTFNDALANVRKAGTPDQMRTYPEAIGGSNVDHAVAQIKQSAMDTVQTMQASSSYNHMITQWGINSQLWMSKMNVITTAVSQVSQGFKTLFRISG